MTIEDLNKLFPPVNPWSGYIRRFQAYCLLHGKTPEQIKNADYLLWLQEKLKHWKKENNHPMRSNGEYKPLTPIEHELFDDWLMSLRHIITLNKSLEKAYYEGFFYGGAHD